MKNLKQYIDSANNWGAIFREPPITFPLSQAAVDKLVSSLNGDLSPENLHCDGEISAAEANKKYQFFKAVAAELADYAHKNQLTMAEVYEL